jgi:hypothetical protein
MSTAANDGARGSGSRASSFAALGGQPAVSLKRLADRVFFLPLPFQALSDNTGRPLRPPARPPPVSYFPGGGGTGGAGALDVSWSAGRLWSTFMSIGGGQGKHAGSERPPLLTPPGRLYCPGGGQRGKTLGAPRGPAAGHLRSTSLSPEVTSTWGGLLRSTRCWHEPFGGPTHAPPSWWTLLSPGGRAETCLGSGTFRKSPGEFIFPGR